MSLLFRIKLSATGMGCNLPHKVVVTGYGESVFLNHLGLYATQPRQSSPLPCHVLSSYPAKMTAKLKKN